MRDLATLTAADFEAAVETLFTVVCGLEDLDLRLVEVVRLPERPGFRPPFSARFRGPTSPALGQDIHRLVNPVMGELELFLVPVGGDAGAMTYEAVFA